MKAYELKTIVFPDCYDNCELAQYLGVGECESACPWKFDKKGNPLEKLDERVK